jgi:hypothetical protein
MRNFARIRERCGRIVTAITGPAELTTPEPRPWSPPQREQNRAIVTVDLSGNEVRRGDVLIVDMDAIQDDPQGEGGDTLAELHRIHAPDDLIQEVSYLIKAST